MAVLLDMFASIFASHVCAGLCPVKPNDCRSTSWYKIIQTTLVGCCSHKELSSKQQFVAARALPTCITMECLKVGRLNSLDSGSGRCCSSPGRESGRLGPDWGAVHHSSPFPSVWWVKVIKIQHKLNDTSPARRSEVHLQLKSQNTPFPDFGPIPQLQMLGPPFSWINPFCFPQGLLKKHRKLKWIILNSLT